MTHISAHPGYGSNAENQQYQPLHCQTIVQCMMLNADVCKERWGVGKMRTPAYSGGMKTGSFFRGRSLWTTPFNLFIHPGSQYCGNDDDLCLLEKAGLTHRNLGTD